MKNVSKIAKQIISRTLSNLPSIKVDFSKIKRKTLELEKEITNFDGDDATWETIEKWKPSAEEIIKSIEDLMEKI